MRLLGILLLTLAVLIGVTFSVLNADPVLVHYYVGTKEIPLSILVIGVLVLGIIIGMFTSFPTVLRLKMEIRRLHRGQG